MAALAVGKGIPLARSAKTFVSLVLLGGAAAALAAPAEAAPSIFGPTGYILTPDCNVVRETVANVGYHYVGAGPVNGVPASYGTANAGLMDHLELGVTYAGGHGPGGPSGVMGNLKASVFKPDNVVQLAGGVIDVANTTARTAYVTALVNGYWVMRHQNILLKGLKVGGGYGKGGALDATWLHGSFQVGTPVELIGEWVNYHNGPNRVNAGLRFRLGPAPIRGLALDLFKLNIGGGPNSAWATGLSFKKRFGKHGSHSTDPKLRNGDQAEGFHPGGLPTAAAD